MKEESHNPWTDPELEARIVALVLGEASDFERDELNRLVDQRPELATLKEQIQSVHGLLRDVGTGESVAHDDDWKLSAEKRNAVLAVIGGEVEDQSAKQVSNTFAERQKPLKGNLWSNLTKIAAVFCVVGFFGSMAFFLTDSARLRQLASNEANTRDPKDASEPVFLGQALAPSRGFHVADDAKAMAADRRYVRTADPTAVADIDSEANSKSALWAIRGALDFDVSTSIEGVNGPEPSARQTVDDPTRIVNDEAGWSDGLNLDGYRSTDSQRAAQKAGNVELSLPMSVESAGELNASETARSTVSVPDHGTILRGGVKRLVQGRSEPGISGKPTVSSPMSHEFAEPEIGAETQDVTTQGMAVLGLDDRPALEGEMAVLGLDDRPAPEGESESSGFDAFHALEWNSGKRRQPLSELQKSLAAGEDKQSNGVVADGESLGFGGFGMASNDERRQGISAEHQPQKISQRESDVRLGTGELEAMAPSQPKVAGIANGTAATDAEESFGTKISTMAREASSLSSSTNKPMAEKEDLGSIRKLAVDRYDEETAKDSVTMPDEIRDHTLGAAPALSQSLRVGDVTLPNIHTVDGGEFYADSVTGTEIGQPRGERTAEEAKQNNDWDYDYDQNGDSGRHRRGLGTSPSTRYGEVDETDQPATRVVDSLGIEKRVKDSLGDLSAQNELYKRKVITGALLPNEYNDDVDEYWRRPKSELKAKQDELLRQRGRSAIAGENRWYRYVPPMLEDNSESMKKAPETKPATPAGLNEKAANDETFSTFSLHVSDVSFKLARAALANGEWPDAAKVRIEEFVNAFDYGDPMPSQSEKVACCVEQSIHPFLQQRNLLRVSMRTAAAGRSNSTPLRLTLLLDNSGSMERADRQQTVRRAFALLAQQLKPFDQVTLISFARQPRLLADKVGGSQSHQLVQLIHNLPSEGGTNIEAALQLAFEKAQEQQVDDAQNRIILLTDGAVNLGDANPVSLSRMIETMRDAGIAFDAAGISAEGLNDEILEALTRKGDGRYYLLDSLEAADDGFARQIAGALRPSAKNVKVQVEFNPKRVGRYKLLGFEKHRLKKEDFRNDTVDAAEMAAAEAGVAVYQFEAKPDGEGDVGSVSVRFRDVSTGQMIENRWPIPFEADVPRLAQAAPSLRVATSAALFAAKLRGEPLGETVDLKTLSDLISGLPDRDRNAKRVGQLQLMVQQARQVSGK